MGQVDTKLVEAQQAVRRAESDVQRAKNAAVRLKRVRAEGSKLKREYQKAEVAARKAIAECNVAEQNVTNVHSALVKLENQQPSDLPSDAQMAAWEAQREELRQRLAKCAEEKRAANDRLNLARSRVFELEPTLQRLRFEEATLVRLAKGEDPNDPAWARGGVTTLGA